MDPNEEKQKLKSDRLFKMAIGVSLLFGVTWGLPGVFNWLFFGAAFYLFFLSWFHRPRKAPEPTYERFQQGAANMHEQRQNASKRIAIIISLVIFGFFFFLILIGTFMSDDEGMEVTTTESYTNEDRMTLAEDPNNVEALTNIANEFLSDSQYDSAIFYYQRIINLDRQNENALYSLGVAYYNQTQYQKSIDVLRACAQAYPENGDALLILGHDYYDQQKMEDAFVWYTKAYEKGVRNAFLSHVLGYLHDTKGNVQRAIEFYKEAVEQDSTKTDVYTRLAELEPANATRYTELAERWKSN